MLVWSSSGSGLIGREVFYLELAYLIRAFLQLTTFPCALVILYLVLQFQVYCLTGKLMHWSSCTLLYCIQCQFEGGGGLKGLLPRACMPDKGPFLQLTIIPRWTHLLNCFLKDFPIAFCRELLSQQPSQNQLLLEKLGTKFQYEINIGYNGKIWVKAVRPIETIFIFNALERLVELQ